MHKPAQRKKSAPADDTSRRFFERELAGEEAPSFQTMHALFQRATQVHMREPWEDLHEEELVVFQEPVSKTHCYCSVMGSLGEARVLHVYIGAPSYFWFQKLHQGYPATVADFYANQNSVFVHYVPLKQIDAVDRELLKVMQHPLAKGTVGPVFRTIRPGYYPWFVTENEARILTTAMEAVLAVCDLLDQQPDLDLWDTQDVYPFVTLDVAKDGRQKYEVSEVDAPSPELAMPRLPAPDTKRVQRIVDRKLSSKGALEVDHFYTEGMIGEKHARKACLRIALAIEAKTALALPPEVCSPEESTGEILQRLVLGAIETRRAIPTRVHVRDREFKILLDPLAQALDFEVSLTKSLPALDFAKSEMLTMLGGL